MLFRILLFVLLALPLCSASAHAQDYVEPTWANLNRTMVRFNALNLGDPVLIDEYAIVTECDLYKAFYHDDFKWNQVREAVRKSVQMNAVTFPISYHYDIKMQLDRYDFAARTFRFTAKSALRNVNTFVLFNVEGTGCGLADVRFIPRTYRAVLSSPLYMEGLPLSPQDAKALYKQMEEEKNIDRIIYGRFNLRIVYIDPLRKESVKSGNDVINRYQQSNMSNALAVRFDVRLDSVDFYSDPQMTKLIYHYQP